MQKLATDLLAGCIQIDVHGNQIRMGDCPALGQVTLDEINDGKVDVCLK